jgi:GT2 family glycosyltransferase
MVGYDRFEDTLDSLREQSHPNWVAASLPTDGSVTGFVPADLRTFLETEAIESEIIVFCLGGSIFERSALQRLVEIFTDDNDVCIAYGDFDVQIDDGGVWPIALPTFDYERSLEQGYCAFLFAMRRSLVETTLNAGATNLFRLFSAALDTDDLDRNTIAHAPGALAILPNVELAAASSDLANSTRAHFEARGISADVNPGQGELLPSVKIRRAFSRERLSIAIPTRNRADLLKACIASIASVVSSFSAELIVIDNDSRDEETLSYLHDLASTGARVLREPGTFNYARLMNRAVDCVSGDIVCLLNNDVRALDDDWLPEMLGRLTSPDVGAVGCLLVRPSGVIQHGGIVLGPQFSAAHAFTDRLASDNGYSDLLRVARECSAVTAACLLTRSVDYRRFGGLDELNFPINFNDVDYCLKLRAEGKKVIFTPHARLEHQEGATRGIGMTAEGQQRFQRELRLLRAKWGNVIAEDPYYSPILSPDPNPYTALAARAPTLKWRTNRNAIARATPLGF